MSEIVIFEDDARPVEIRLEGETLWATQKQMAELFETTPENVLMHLRNVYQEDELAESATAKDFLVVRQEGKRQVRRRLKHYNLDAVIPVGYRVSSRRATRFRQWATRVLREHLTQGYSLNEHRLARRVVVTIGHLVVQMETATPEDFLVVRQQWWPAAQAGATGARPGWGGRARRPSHASGSTRKVWRHRMNAEHLLARIPICGPGFRKQQETDHVSILTPCPRGNGPARGILGLDVR